MPYILFGILEILILLSLSASPAYAATSNTSTAPGGFLFIAASIAYLTRRRSIGGWLFYFYLQFYTSILIAIFLFPIIFLENINPAEWDDIKSYIFFQITIVPIYVVTILELFFATKLLFKKQRTLHNVCLLRYILIASVVVFSISLFIDSLYFPDNITFDILPLIFSIIWCAYFYKSDRVQWVLIENKWDYLQFKERGYSTEKVKEEKQKDKTTKKCPYCGEDIQNEAIKCSFCGGWLKEE